MHNSSSNTIKFISIAVIAIALIVIIGLIAGRKAQAPEEIITENNSEVIVGTEAPTNPTTFTTIINHNDTVTANQVITGSVPGFWFFEGDFPVELLDNNDNVFATVIATSSEDWMTTNIIPFTITTPATLDYTGPGKIIFKRNDPSDGESNIPASETTATILVNFQ